MTWVGSSSESENFHSSFSCEMVGCRFDVVRWIYWTKLRAKIFGNDQRDTVVCDSNVGEYWSNWFWKCITCIILWVKILFTEVNTRVKGLEGDRGLTITIYTCWKHLSRAGSLPNAPRVYWGTFLHWNSVEVRAHLPTSAIKRGYTNVRILF